MLLLFLSSFIYSVLLFEKIDKKKIARGIKIIKRNYKDKKNNKRSIKIKEIIKKEL